MANRSQIRNYQLDDAIAVDPDVSARLSAVRTRLNAFSSQEQAKLANWATLSATPRCAYLAPLLGHGLQAPKLPHRYVPLAQSHAHGELLAAVPVDPSGPH